MTDHTFTFANDGYRVEVKATVEDEEWCRLIAAIVDVLRSPTLVLMTNRHLTDEEADSIRREWTSRRH